MQPIRYSHRLLIPSALLLLAGCATAPTPIRTANPGAIQGSVHGGQQPVTGATIQLYAVGTTGDGSAATPLVSSTILTDATGSFNITGDYTCPSASSLVYLVATGGNPGLGAGGNNPQLALMAALGPCGNLTTSTFISINEVTTVSAVYALSSFASGPTNVGSYAGDASSLAAAFTVASEFANTSTGTSPGANIPAGYTVPVAQINTIADIMAVCINSAGGVSGDGSACGSFLALTTPSGVTAATDTITSLFHLAQNPTLNTAALFNLATPASPFQPVQTQLPPDLSVHLTVPVPPYTVSPSTLTFQPSPIGLPQPSQNISITNQGSIPAVQTSFTITGPNASDFTATVLDTAEGLTCYSPSQGSTCTIAISFVPQALGTRTAYFIYVDNEDNTEYSVLLTGSGSGQGATGPITLTSPNFIAPNTTAILTLTNAGPDSLAISNISLAYSLQGTQTISQTNNCGTTLYAQSICTITVSAGAAGSTLSSAVLTVTDDYAPGAIIVPINAITPVPAYSFTDFGPRALGTTSEALAPGSLGGPAPSALSGTNPGDFTYNYHTCQLVHGQNACVYSVSFEPTALGPRSATIDYGTGFITLSGFGIPAGPSFSIAPQLYLSETNGIIFLSETTVNSQLSVSATVTDTGTTDLSFGSAVVTGPDASAFSVTGCSSVTAAPTASQSCTFTIAITPTHFGTNSATVTFTDSTSGVSQSVSYAVYAVASSPVANPSSLTFPNTAVGTTSPAQTVTLSDYCNGGFFVSGVSGPFQVTSSPSCAQSPCPFSIVFAPTSVSLISGQIAFTDALSKQLTYFNVTGTGLGTPVVSLSSTMVNFASRPVSSTSIPVTVQLNNTGAGTLNIASISLTGADPSDYVLTNNCGASLAASTNCNFTISFSPTATGTRTASVQIISNAASSPDTVSLSGIAY